MTSDLLKRAVITIPRKEIKKRVTSSDLRLIKGKLTSLNFELVRISFVQTLYFNTGEFWADNIRLRRYPDDEKSSQWFEPQEKYSLEYKVIPGGEKIRISDLTLDEFDKFLESSEAKRFFNLYSYSITNNLKFPIQLSKIIYYQREYYQLKNKTDDLLRVTINLIQRHYEIQKRLLKISKPTLLSELALSMKERPDYKVELKMSTTDSSPLPELLFGSEKNN